MSLSSILSRGAENIPRLLKAESAGLEERWSFEGRVIRRQCFALKIGKGTLTPLFQRRTCFPEVGFLNILSSNYKFSFCVSIHFSQK